MKLRLCFKTPDVLELAQADNGQSFHQLDEEIRQNLIVSCSKWVEYGEGIAIEIDTNEE